MENAFLFLTKVTVFTEDNVDRSNLKEPSEPECFEFKQF